MRPTTMLSSSRTEVDLDVYVGAIVKPNPLSFPRRTETVPTMLCFSEEGGLDSEKFGNSLETNLFLERFLINFNDSEIKS